MVKKPAMRQLPSYWAPFHGGPYNPADEVDTGLTADRLHQITDGLVKYPEDFHIHPKVQKLLEQRREMGYGKRPLDFGMAEALAFGSLALEDTPIRLSGQDSRRGTFNQRHSVLIDIVDEKEYVPLCHLAPNQARVEIYNSELSEAAVMGFEYGYSRDYPGDPGRCGKRSSATSPMARRSSSTSSSSSGEDKWDLLSGLVLLLPHGHEGQGPEHSSARIERYLQLCARDNMQVCQPSTAAQYFHLLRRQALRKWRKPLICFTPKSMLRHPEALSPLSELERPRFLNVIPDETALDAKRVLLCTGKIGHELRMERRKLKDAGPAIISLEQMYPFPEDEIRADPGPLQECGRVHLGAGRAGEHGRALFRDSALETDSWLKASQHQACRKLDASNWLGESPRTGAEDASHIGLGQGGVELRGPRLSRSQSPANARAALHFAVTQPRSRQRPAYMYYLIILRT